MTDMHELDLRTELESEMANLEWMEDKDNEQSEEDIESVRKEVERLQREYNTYRERRMS